MTSHRKADRRFAQWVRYFGRYSPEHLATPGMLRAYDACVRASYTNQRADADRRLRYDLMEARRHREGRRFTG